MKRECNKGEWWKTQNWSTVSKLLPLDFFECQFTGAALFLFENFPIIKQVRLNRKSIADLPTVESILS